MEYLSWEDVLAEFQENVLPNVSVVPQPTIEEVENEIHVGTSLIRVPVLEVTQNERETVEVGTDPPERLSSLPLDIFKVIPSQFEFEMITEENFQTFQKELAKQLHLENFATNFYSFWILDCVSNLIWDSQKYQMDRDNQITLINWFFALLTTIRDTSVSRKDFFEHIKILYGKTTIWMASNGSVAVPALTPLVINVDEIYTRSPTKAISEERPTAPPQSERVEDITVHRDPNSMPTYPDFFIENKDLFNYANLLYDLFAGRLEFEIIRESFWHEPLVEGVMLSERIMVPKLLRKKDPKEQDAEYRGSRGTLRGTMGGRKKSVNKRASKAGASRRQSAARRQSSARRGSAKKGGMRPEKIKGNSLEELAIAQEEKMREKRQCILLLKDAVDDDFFIETFKDLDISTLDKKKLASLNIEEGSKLWIHFGLGQTGTHPKDKHQKSRRKSLKDETDKRRKSSDKGRRSSARRKSKTSKKNSK